MSGDLVLIYYSGHGKLDDDGNLYLATKDTDISVLPPTSVSVLDIKTYAQTSLASKIVIILDCCFSGAVNKLYKGEVTDQALEAMRKLEGQGTFYLTASTDIQLAEEKEGDEYSLLTKHIIAGIRDGKADLNDDGQVSFQELCSYVQVEVSKEGRQRPKVWSLEASGDVTIARSGKPPYSNRKRAVTKKVYELGNKDLLTEDDVATLLKLIKETEPGVAEREGLPAQKMAESLYLRIDDEGAFVRQAILLADSVPRMEAERLGAEQKGREEAEAKEKAERRVARSWEKVLISKIPARTTGLAVTAIVLILAGVGIVINRIRQQPASVLSGLKLSKVERDLEPQRNQLITYRRLKGRAEALAYSPNGRWLASGMDSGVDLWNAETGQKERTLDEPSRIFSLAFSPDGRWLASGVGDPLGGTLWDFATGAKLRTLRGARYGVDSVVFSPDGRLLAYGGIGGTLRIMDPATGQVVRIVAPVEKHETISSLAFSPDGRSLALNSGNGVRILDPATGKQLRTLSETSSTHSLAFSPDGRWLASGTWAGTITLWEASTGDRLRILNGHKDSVNSVVFSPDGRWLASASTDKTVKLWDTATGQELRTLTGNDSLVYCVVFSPKGQLLASGSYTDTLVYNLQGLMQ